MDDRSAALRLLVVAAAWIGSATLLAQHAAPWLPRALAAQLGLQSFLSLVLCASSALAAALLLKLVPRPREALALVRPSPSACIAALAAVPLLSALSMYAGFELALPTLLEEIRTGGRQAAQSNTGEFGRALVETHLATTLVWALVLTPLAEEGMFRGALWGGVERLTLSLERPSSLPPELLERRRFDVRRWALRGGVATLASAAVFAWLHADQQGGAGIVRLVQVSCLGLALGLLRQGSGSLLPGVVLHAGFNLLGLAKSRKWIPAATWPAPLPIPLLYWQLAAGGAVLGLLLLAHRLRALATVRLTARIHVARPREAVFDFIVTPESIPLGFHGHGPIPGALRAELVGEGPMRAGALRRVHNADGSVVDEHIRELERPSLQRYELTSGTAAGVLGMGAPFSWLVRGAEGRWQLEPEGEGTDVTWTFEWRLTTGLAWPIARLLGRSFARAMQACLIRQRAHLEGA